jgi:Fe(3+) dicitrate transport protein
MKHTVLATAITAALMSTTPLAEESMTPSGVSLAGVETIKIIGSKSDARGLAGSSAVIDEQQMQVEVTTDIHQVLKTVPGIYIQEEDGQGLRPNIGIRAANSGRSSKITLLEDGVMIAPAPYSNPAAYYFPTTFRMSSVEVLKGAPLLRFGPQTTGGVVNLVTTAIPDQQSCRVITQFGENSSRDIHAYIGGTEGNFGYLLETVQRSSAGFKDIDRSNRDTGFDIEDYVVKLKLTDDNQSLLAKLQYSEEISNETYAGLTDADFRRDANRRYGLSDIDQMDNSHKGYSLNYNLDINDSLSLNLVGYYNEFARNWFKAGVAGGLINSANSGDTQAQAILDGDMDLAGIKFKNNNRAYESYGLEANLGIDLNDHSIQVGARDHRDTMDRFQPQDVYDQINGSLVFQSVIDPTGGDNRLEEADALSLWVTDNWQVTDALKVNLALRYEDVESARRQFNDVARNDLGSFRSNNSDEWLPGASFTYDLNTEWQVLAGVHKGFSPLGGGAKEEEEPETSINYEAGVRFSRNGLFAEAIVFYSDFSNKSELCSVATPCSNGAESGTFSTGDAVVSGLEVQLSQTLDLGSYSMPIDFSYTYSNAEISKDNAVVGVFDGDELAGVPTNMASLRVALDSGDKWYHYAVAKYIDETCVSLGCNNSDDAFGKTDSLFVMDIVSRYQLNSQTTLYVKVENLLDKQEIIARTPQGARPNKPQTASVGVEYSF